MAVAFLMTWVAPPTIAQQDGDKAADVFGKDVIPKDQLLPQGVEVTAGFEPGEGEPIGTVVSVEEKGIVNHLGMRFGFVIQGGTAVVHRRYARYRPEHEYSVQDER